MCLANSMMFNLYCITTAKIIEMKKTSGNRREHAGEQCLRVPLAVRVSSSHTIGLEKLYSWREKCVTSATLWLDRSNTGGRKGPPPSQLHLFSNF